MIKCFQVFNDKVSVDMIRSSCEMDKKEVWELEELLGGEFFFTLR